MQQANEDDQEHRAAAVRLNALAAHIRSKAEARAFVDAIAETVSAYLPPQWLEPSIRSRVAAAEYASVNNGASLIPERRLVDVWNRYVEEIGAPEESRVTVAEVHAMRTAAYASQRAMWVYGINQTLWTMPNSYALTDSGELAEGCRAIEALNLLRMMHDSFDNVLSARERLRVTSSRTGSGSVSAVPLSTRRRSDARMELRPTADPVGAAEYRYVKDHGVVQLNRLVSYLLDNLFPE